MSSSPFEIFRRNLKPLMVLLTGLAMFAFVVLPVLDSYMRQNMNTSGGDDEIVAEFGNTTLTRGRVDYFTRNHNATVRFLRELAEKTISRQGVPKTAGFQYDAQNQRIESLGINEAPSPLGTIRTFQFASLAGDSGFVLDDVMIQAWLQQFTDGMFSDSEINSMLMTSTRQQMGRFHLYEQLRHQLLADIYLRGAFSTLMDGRMPLMTPAEQWASFLKLNRKATVQTYGVLVNDYLDQTNKTPSEAEIAAVYEEGKDRDPDEQSPDPGFHRRYSATFEYLEGNYQSFLDEEIAKLSEEQLRAEYDRRLKGGDFQLPENATMDQFDGAPDPLQGATNLLKDLQQKAKEKSAEMPAVTEETPAEPKDAPAEKKESPAETKDAPAETKDAPAETKDAPAETKDAPADAEKTKDVAADSATADDPAEDAADSPPAKEGDPATESSDPPKDDQPKSEDSGDAVSDKDTETPADEPKPSDQSQLRSKAVQLVALQDKDDAADETEAAASDEESTETPDSGDEPKADPPEADESKADESKADDAKADDAKADDAKADDAKPADPAKTDSTSTDDDAAADEKKSDEPKVETFEDVRQQLAEEMAGPQARRRMDSSVTELTSKMRRYFNERAIHESNVSIGQAGDPPVRPNLKMLAAELGFQHVASIGPYDAVSISNEPISRSFEVGSELMRRGPGFGPMMFGFNNGRSEMQPQPLFSPLRTADDQAGKIFVSWKTGETEAFTPRLDQVRSDVVMAIRVREARQLAVKAAEELAKKAATAGETSLVDLVPPEKKGNVKEGLGPFSWLDSFGFQGATIGNVPELDSVGPKFMEAVFSRQPGEFGVAMNQPERVAYVVSPSKFEPELEELRRQFKQPTNRMMAMFVAGGDADEIIRGFYEAADKKTDFSTSLDE